MAKSQTALKKQQSALLSADEVAAVLRCHKVTLWRWLKTVPDFPRPIWKSPGRIAFFEHEIRDYISSRPRSGVGR